MEDAEEQLQNLFNLLDPFGCKQRNDVISYNHLNWLDLNLEFLLFLFRQQGFDFDVMFMFDQFLEEDLMSDAVTDEVIEKGPFYELDKVKHIEDGGEDKLF
jgi:hypothetical protein